jgi:hypothetical protein
MTMAKAAEAPDNLHIWNRVEKTNPDFTKKFKKGGGFSGTAINAVYLAKKATEVFGPIGIGWGVNVLEEKVHDAAPGDKIHSVRIELWYMQGDKKGSVQHFGQTMLCGKNKHGPYSDEDAPKKSLTDAMTKALSLLGFSADVHLGFYDDNKYVRDLEDEFSHNERASTSVNGKASNGKASNGGNDDLVGWLKGELDKCESIKAVTDFMNHKDTKKDLASLSTADCKLVRDHGTKRLKDLGWGNGGTAPDKDKPSDKDKPADNENKKTEERDGENLNAG